MAETRGVQAVDEFLASFPERLYFQLGLVHTIFRIEVLVAKLYWYCKAYEDFAIHIRLIDS